ncbi:MAG TPA: hypothetical protein VN754_11790, partial [Candidatus Binataceae bacterium]|nr:hypothetical protein [Candidatus Binataceae bacterium]
MRKVGVTFVAMGLMVAALCLPASAQLTVGVFGLKPNPPFLKCLQSAATVTPSATVVIKQNEANDDLTIVALGIKPNLAFDLFTVQNSNLLASGSVNPAFKNFGLAWYQTDLQADAFGRIGATIRSILINQIFGFDAGTTPPLPPTNTFHVGFWFNNPADANVPGKCVFD